MLFNYYENQRGEIIRNYQVIDDKIIVIFLDKTAYEIPYSEETEKKLLNEMIRQAKMRNNSPILSDLLEINQMASSKIKFDTLLLMIDTYYGLFHLEGIGQVIAAIIGGFIGLDMAFKFLLYLSSKMGIAEVKKYDIYLEIKDILEEYRSNPHLFDGIQRSEVLNINTLDTYSLKDMEKIKDNLDKINSPLVKKLTRENNGQ